MADQMHSVCRLRLYTEDDRLLTGHPQFVSKEKQLQIQMPNNTTPKCTAMLSHTNEQSDLSSNYTLIKQPHTSRRA